MLVVMVLSSMVVTAIYFAYLTVNTYQMSLTRKYSALEEIIALNDRLEADIRNADEVLKSDSGLQCLQTEVTIRYGIYRNYVVRQQNSVIDTFHYRVSEQAFMFQGKVQAERGAALDEVVLEGQIANQSIRYHILKRYDAASLVRFIKPDSIP